MSSSGIFTKILSFVVRSGSLRLIDGAGRTHDIGDGTPPTVIVRLLSGRLDTTLAFNPSLSLGEAYMDGALVIEQGTLYEFLAIIGQNADRMGIHPWLGLLARLGTRIE